MNIYIYIYTRKRLKEWITMDYSIRVKMKGLEDHRLE